MLHNGDYSMHCMHTIVYAYSLHSKKTPAAQNSLPPDRPSPPPNCCCSLSSCYLTALCANCQLSQPRASTTDSLPPLSPSAIFSFSASIPTPTLTRLSTTPAPPEP